MMSKFIKTLGIGLTVWMGSLSTVFAASTEVTQIFQQLAQTPIVRADFEQQKKLPSLNKTFVSNGSLLFAKSYGVAWQIKRPVQADLIVTPTKLVQKPSEHLARFKLINHLIVLLQHSFYS